MREKEIKIMGHVLANPMRRYILQYLVNPSKDPKRYTDIKKEISHIMHKEITDGSLGWYLKDLLAQRLIVKNDTEYASTELGDKIINNILKIIE